MRHGFIYTALLNHPVDPSVHPPIRPLPLASTHPLLQTYPVVTVTPDGGVAVAAGKTLVKYSRNGDRFSRQFAYPDRPGAPWSYPQTGVGLPLPLKPPYDR